MDNALVNILMLVHLVWWPVSKLANAVRCILSPLLHAVLFLLSPIWIVGGFLLLPFIHLAKGLFYIITLPLQVKWLERIEVCHFCEYTNKGATLRLPDRLHLPWNRRPHRMHDWRCPLLHLQLLIIVPQH